jgi:predicted NBD/HSP70 family sugar kinase
MQNKYLCFDIGGTNIKYGILNENLEIQNVKKVSTKPDWNDMQHQIKEILNDHIQNDLDAVCISTAGIVDETHISFANENLKNYIGTDFKKFIQDYLKREIDVYVLNDAKSASCADYDEQYQNQLTITLGTGVGVGVIANGEPLLGHLGIAGEIGYSNFFGGSLDKTLSYSSLIRRCEKYFEGLDSVSLLEAYRNVSEIQKKVDDYLEKLVMFMKNVSLFYSPQAIFLGGGFSYVDEFFINKIKSMLKEINPDWPPTTDVIKFSKFKNDAGLIGVLKKYLLLKSN